MADKIYIKIETVKGIYRVRNPMGRMGAIHFGIVTKYLDGGEEPTIAEKAALEAGEKLPAKKMSPMQRANLAEALIEWTQKVLPNILVGFTPKDSPDEVPIKVDEIKGEEQAAIFYALLEDITVGDEYFRIIE